MFKKVMLSLSILVSALAYSETISEIQGTTHTSPLVNQQVSNVEGVVTAIIHDKYHNGFFMESLKADNDPRTSEGIYVLSKNEPKVGELVSVDGTVKEMQFGRFNPNELTITAVNATNLTVLKEGVKLKPIIIDGSKIPFVVKEGKISDTLDIKKNAMDYFESLEGMLVKIVNPTIVGFAEKYGEIAVIPSHGKYTKDRTDKGGVRYTYENQQTQKIIIGDNLHKLTIKDEYDPEGRERLFSDPNFTPNPGENFKGDIVGVVTFNYSNYKVMNLDKLPAIQDNMVKRDTNRYGYDKDYLNIASYNIENFSALQNPSRVTELALEVKNILKTPDILSLIEVGDDDGGLVKGDTKVVSAKRNIRAIVKSIKLVTGVDYGFLTVAPEDGKDGGWPEMHIRQVILYRKDRLNVFKYNQGNSTTDTNLVVDGKNVSLTQNPGRLGTNSPAFEGVRKTLVGQLRFKDKNVFVLVSHLKSKRADDKIYTVHQPVVRKSEILRDEEGKEINLFIKNILKADPKAIVLSMGDMNDFDFSNSMKNMKGNEMVSIFDILPKNERHTYIFQGNSQVLDNLMVNKEYSKGMRADVINCNTGFTKSQGYFSDHDPVFMQIKIK